jgi:hypothetical protein
MIGKEAAEGVQGPLCTAWGALGLLLRVLWGPTDFLLLSREANLILVLQRLSNHLD